MPRFRNISDEDLNVRIARHDLWLKGDSLGQRAIFHNTDLSNRDLSTRMLDRADFRGADLHAATLRETSFVGANFREAVLHGARLEGGKLESADFCFADLRHANLRGAWPKWGDWYGTRFDPETVELSGWDAEQVTDLRRRGAVLCDEFPARLRNSGEETAPDARPSDVKAAEDAARNDHGAAQLARDYAKGTKAIRRQIAQTCVEQAILATLVAVALPPALRIGFVSTMEDVLRETW